MSSHLEFTPIGFIFLGQHDCHNTYNKTRLDLSSTLNRKKKTQLIGRAKYQVPEGQCLRKIRLDHPMYSDYVGRVGSAILVQSSKNEMHLGVAGRLIRSCSWKPMLMRFCLVYTRQKIGFSVNFALSGAPRDGFQELDSGSGGPGSYNNGGKGGEGGSNDPNNGCFGDGNASGGNFWGMDWYWCFWLVRKYHRWLSSMAFGLGYHNNNAHWNLENYIEMVCKLLEMAIFRTLSPEIDLLLWFVLLAGGWVANAFSRAFNEFSCLCETAMAMTLGCAIVMAMLLLMAGYNYFRLE